MKRKRLSSLNFFLVVLVFFAGCSRGNDNTSSAGWAFSFVVWDDYIYQIDSEYVQEVDEEIGEVTLFSDMEGDSYAGNFSNEYEEGTKYFSIPGISTEEAIAIEEEEEGKYRKAIRGENYEGR